MSFLAKSGKVDELADGINKTWQWAVDMERQDAGDESADEMAASGSIKKGANSVSLEVLMPDSMEKEDEEMADAFDQVNPSLTGSMCVGSTIEEMYKDKSKNLAVLPGGVEATLSAGFSKMVFQVLSEMMPGEGIGMFKAMTSYKAREEFRYAKPDEIGDAFDDVPSLEE